MLRSWRANSLPNITSFAAIKHKTSLTSVTLNNSLKGHYFILITHFIVSKLLEIHSPAGFTISPRMILVLFAHDHVNMKARHLSKHDSRSGNQTSYIAKYWSLCQRILTDMIWTARLHFCYNEALSKSLSLRRVNRMKRFPLRC